MYLYFYGVHQSVYWGLGSSVYPPVYGSPGFRGPSERFLVERFGDGVVLITRAWSITELVTGLYEWKMLLLCTSVQRSGTVWVGTVVATLYLPSSTSQESPMGISIGLGCLPEISDGDLWGLGTAVCC